MVRSDIKSSQIALPRCLSSDVFSQMAPPRCLLKWPLPDVSSQMLPPDSNKNLFRVSCWCQWTFPVTRPFCGLVFAMPGHGQAPLKAKKVVLCAGPQGHCTWPCPGAVAAATAKVRQRVTQHMAKNMTEYKDAHRQMLKLVWSILGHLYLEVKIFG